MGAEIKWHPDHLVCELLWRIHRRVRSHDHRSVRNNGTAAELAATGIGRTNAAVVAPLAGVIHIRLTLFEQLSVAGEWIDVLRAGDRDVDLLLNALLAVSPLHVKAFFLEQALLIGHQLRQSLEWRGGLEHQRLHVSAP